MCFTNSFIRHFFAPASDPANEEGDYFVAWYHGHYTTQFANILCIYNESTNVMKKSLLFDGGLTYGAQHFFFRAQKTGRGKKCPTISGNPRKLPSSSS